MNESNIVVLNGASSSGKSTLAKTIQELSKKIYMIINHDNFCLQLPHKLIFQDFYWFTKPEFSNFHNGFISMIDTLAETKNNLIIDVVLYGVNRTDKFFNILKKHNFFLIGLECENKTLEEREKERGDRKQGLAVETNINIHNDLNYDLLLKTDKEAPEELAKKLLNYIGEKTD